MDANNSEIARHQDGPCRAGGLGSAEMVEIDIKTKGGTIQDGPPLVDQDF
jgi:hypothetical protein